MKKNLKKSLDKLPFNPNNKVNIISLEYDGCLIIKLMLYFYNRMVVLMYGLYRI